MNLSRDYKINEWIKERLKPESAGEILLKKNIPVHKHSFWYYWGGFTLFCLIIQVITGVLLMLYYKPAIEEAHASIVYITNTVPFGSFIRSLHSWSASLLILSASIHMSSVFFLKSYRKPQELLWMSGVIVFLIILAFGFTGFLLPWNELSYFGTLIGLAEMEKFPVIGTAIAHFLKGGNQITSSTLNRIFALHAGLLPLLTLVFLGLHLLLNRLYDYSLPIGIKLKSVPVKYYKDFFYRLSIGWMVLLAMITTLAVLMPKDTGKAFDIYNLTEPPSSIHPEWYFMFLFQTLKSESVVPPELTVALISLFSLFWLLVPVLDKKASNEAKSSLFTFIGILIIAYIFIMTILGYAGTGGAMWQYNNEANNYISTGGIHPFYFLGTILFTIFIMIALLLIKIMNKKQSGRILKQ